MANTFRKSSRLRRRRCPSARSASDRCLELPREERVLECPPALHLAHEVDGFEREPARAAEVVAVAVELLEALHAAELSSRSSNAARAASLERVVPESVECSRGNGS
jgi:hypothetical protein